MRRTRRPEKTPAYLLMDIELSKYLRRVEKMLILKDSGLLSALPFWPRSGSAHFFALYASNGRLRTRAIQYPFTRKRTVRKACTAASGTM